jgi:DNA repair protein RecO (recombination protein O)
VADRARVYKTEGVILRRRNVGEADSIFTVFSDREGKFDAVARGVRKARSHMRGHLEPFTRSRVMLARGRTLDVFTQAETLTPYRSIREDLERSASAMYCAELVDRFTAEHIEQPGLYALILDVLDALEGGAPAHVVRFFEMQLLSLMGYDLQLSACAVCAGRLGPEETLLSPSAGGFVCAHCRGTAGPGRLLSLRAMKVLRFARSTDLAGFTSVRIDDELAVELQRALAEVIRYLLDREPASGRFVDEVTRLTRTRAPTADPGVQLGQTT